MKKQTEYPISDDLLMKYLRGDLTREETAKLKAVLNANPEAKNYLEKMENIWTHSTVLNDFQRIDKDQDWLLLKEKIGSLDSKPVKTIRNQSRRLSYRIMRVAAIILLALAFSFTLYYLTGNGTLSKTEWVTVHTNEDPQDIILGDGTEITLNINSQLEYPVEFKGRNRMVRLNGEAFFEVARDEQKPFLVIASEEASVEVLGTSFNIRNAEGKVFLNVVSGTVAFYPKGQKNKGKLLTQNEQAYYENGNIRDDLSFDLNFLSWKTNTLQFENTPLESVFDQLGRHYQKNFLIMDHALDSISLTAVYNNQGIEEVLEEIALLLDIVFEELNGSIEVKPTD